MNLAQLVIIIIASVSVARAYICLGLMTYKLKWLNYVIALVAGIVGAWIGLMNPATRGMALVVSVFSAVIFLAVYHGFRWYFVISPQQDEESEAELEAKENLLAIKSNN